MDKPLNTDSKKIRDIGIIFLFLFVIALIFPKAFWGMNHLYFLPTILIPLVFICIGFLMFFYPRNEGKPLYETALKPLSNLNRWQVKLAAALVMCVLFYLFPIYYDIYGDAAFLFESENQIIKDITWEGLAPLYSFDYTDPKIGTGTNLSLVALFSYLLDVSAQQVFRVWDAICGGVFVFFWLGIVSLLVKKDGWKTIAVILGVTAPFLQNFFGHYEVYAPVLAGMAAYFYVLIQFFQTKKTKYLFILVPLFFLVLKFHVTIYLLAPSLILTFIYWKTSEKTSSFFTLKNSLKFIMAPIVIIGGALYVVMGGFKGQRSYTQDDLAEVVFLPFVSSEEAPLDRYSLISPAHFFDYLNQMFLWSAAGLFILVCIVIIYRKRINWNQPLLLVTGYTLIIYFGFFFIMNPLLSMPNDWDLFSMPAIPLLVFVLLLIQQIEGEKLPKELTGGVLSFSLLSIMIFVTNAVPSALSGKLEYQGMWEFQTYWIGSSSSILEGIKLEENEKVRHNRLLKVIEELEPYAVEGEDLEYAELLHQTGLYYTTDSINPGIALKYFELSDRYYDNICKNHFFLIDAYYKVGKYQEALAHGDQVVLCQFPTQIQAYEAYIHVALTSGEDELALKLCNELLEIYPEEPFITKVQAALVNGEDASVYFGGVPRTDNQLSVVSDTSVQNVDFVNLATFVNQNKLTNDSLRMVAKGVKDTLQGTSEYYALLNVKIGKFYYENKFFDSSLVYYDEAAKHAEKDCEIPYHQLINKFMLGDFVGANSHSKKLVECEWPNANKAYRMAMHTAAMAGDIEGLSKYVNGFLNRWPEDDFVNRIRNAINSGQSPEAISKFFQNG